MAAPLTRHTPSPTWTAVDGYALSHTHPASRPNSAALSATLSASAAAGLPEISVSAAQGKFLALHCRSARVAHALEVGTLGGYSAIWLASENPGLKVTSVEVDPVHAEVARGNVKKAGLEGQVEVVLGAGVDVLGRLQGEVERGERERFGFVFVDADKKNNWEYVRLAKGMVESGAVICVDNIVRGGRLVDEGSQGEAGVLGSRRVVEEVGRAEGLDAVVLQTVGEKSYDGWLWIVVE